MTERQTHKNKDWTDFSVAATFRRSSWPETYAKGFLSGERAGHYFPLHALEPLKSSLTNWWSSSLLFSFQESLPSRVRVSGWVRVSVWWRWRCSGLQGLGASSLSPIEPWTAQPREGRTMNWLLGSWSSKMTRPCEYPFLWLFSCVRGWFIFDR